jgi:hypothetical protein
MEPIAIQLNSVMVVESCPEDFITKNKIAVYKNDNSIAELPIIPAMLCFKPLPEKPMMRNPSKGKTGTSQARFIKVDAPTISIGSKG